MDNKKKRLVEKCYLAIAILNLGKLYSIVVSSVVSFKSFHRMIYRTLRELSFFSVAAVAACAACALDSELCQF